MVRLICTIICLIVLASSAAAEPYPDGLSTVAKAKFAQYDARMVAAIRKSKSDKMEIPKLPVEFPRRHGIAVIREVFGADWGPVREFADAALADLPVVDETKRFSAEPAGKFSMKEAERILGASLAKVREFEEGLSTYRLWDPMRVASMAEMMMLGRTSSEEVARHSVMGGYVSRHLARTTWQERDALVLYAGTWVFVMNYMRTERGLIWTTDIALYPR